MRKVFSTDQMPEPSRFKECQEWNRETFGPSDVSRLGDQPFRAEYFKADFGPISLNKLSSTPGENRVLSHHRRGKIHTSNLVLNIVQAGETHNDHFGNSVILRPGDLCIADSQCGRVNRNIRSTKTLAIVMPRKQIEALVGPSRLYAGLVIGGALPAASLVRSFFEQLLRVHEQFNPEMAQRIAGIGIDLVTASIAERLARDPPRTIHGTVLVQRAKAYVEANLSDPTLNPTQLALAMGVSLRHLQHLFSEHGQHISDWIWERRLTAAYKRLADPSSVLLPIGAVAHGCGFVTQAHFSKRFRDRYGASPSEHRRAHMIGRI